MTITAIREGSVADANARREQARRQARIDKLRAQIEALTALDEEAGL